MNCRLTIGILAALVMQPACFGAPLEPWLNDQLTNKQLDVCAHDYSHQPNVEKVPLYCFSTQSEFIYDKKSKTFNAVNVRKRPSQKDWEVFYANNRTLFEPHDSSTDTSLATKVKLQQLDINELYDQIDSLKEAIHQLDEEICQLQKNSNPDTLVVCHHTLIP
jgi:hypothetical protein